MSWYETGSLNLWSQISLMITRYCKPWIITLLQGKSIAELQIRWVTLTCISIGTPKTINFPFVSNGKLMIFMCPNI